ncbi:MAG TPA: hypothetical protein VGK21_09875 [Candidatus Angelobacter sp.]
MNALKPIHNFAINIARTWIHGSIDLVEVLFTTPLRDSIVIFLPVWKHRFPENRIVICTLAMADKAATSIFIPGDGVCTPGRMAKGRVG